MDSVLDVQTPNSEVNLTRLRAVLALAESNKAVAESNKTIATALERPDVLIQSCNFTNNAPGYEGHMLRINKEPDSHAAHLAAHRAVADARKVVRKAKAHAKKRSRR